MALHYPPLTRNVGCFVTIAATLAVCALLGVSGGPRVLASYVGPVGGADATEVASSAGQMTAQALAPSDRLRTASPLPGAGPVAPETFASSCWPGRGGSC